MLGEDILVLPVLEKGADKVEGYFPKGKWKHLFTGGFVEGGQKLKVNAPLGTPAVYVKVGGKWSDKIYNSVKESIN
jgi:alpha-glucosidase